MRRKTHTESPQKMTTAFDGLVEASTSTPPVDAPRSEGQRLLLAVPASLDAIRIRVGCSKAIASRWRRGEATPAIEFRTRLESEYGIAVAAWDQLPADRLAPPPPLRLASPTRRSAPAEPTRPTTLEEILALLDEPSLLVGDRIKLLAERRRIEEAQRLVDLVIEDRCLRELPAAQRMIDIVLEVTERNQAKHGCTCGAEIATELEVGADT